MTAPFIALSFGALMFLFAARMRATGREREAHIATGLAIASTTAALVLAALQLGFNR